MTDFKNLEQHYAIEERAFLEKIRDICQQVQERYSFYLTDFLNPREIQIAEELAHHFGLQIFVSSKIVPGEYGRVIIAPDYYELEWSDFEISRFEIVYARQFNRLSHSQVLGALINQLGLEREVFGDIILDDQGRVQFQISSKLADYARMSISKIARVSVELKEISEEQAILNQEKSSSRFVLLSSYRLDLILASVLNISRSTAVKLIQSGKVKQNYRLIEKSDQLLEIGDMVSVRGYGRFKLSSQDGFSKSGKSKVTVETILRRVKK